ncbi:hypothetical protein MVEN_00340200 [Mycena venus]|uniref:C2H2-type domain-containing protein n=1 Tax=Mycena venus TaxID=2733690 RepID=A0A8H7D732_9AGAR|nr:hypothetical protein MVEN_00340200 [Mycena venus]
MVSTRDIITTLPATSSGHPPSARFSDATSPPVTQMRAFALIIVFSLLILSSSLPWLCSSAVMAPQLVNPQLFTQNRNKSWKCLICPNSQYTILSQAIIHEDRRSHVGRVRNLDREPAPMSSPLRTAQAADSDSESTSRHSSPIRDPVGDSFGLFGGIPSAFLPRHLPSVHGPALASDDPNQIYDDFAGELARNRPSSQYFGSDDEDNDNYSDELFSDDDTLDLPESEGLLGQYDDQFAEEQRRLAPHNSLVAADEDDWWPWRSKQECLLDLMSGFPRACFSEKELNATRWYAKKNGVSMQPTIKQVKNHRQDILNTAGLETNLLEGKLGNSFAINDWFKILEHEFANPLVRPKLHLYPEDSGEKLEEARQAEKWKEEVDGNISAPMARGNGGKDYYVEEVCFAKLNGDGAVGPVMPMRWFTRNGNIMSTAHPLRLTPSKLAFIIDGSDDACLEIPLENYFLNVRDLEDPECQHHYGIPPPSSISGIFYGPGQPLQEWNQPPVNQWRVKANGRRVHSVPLWEYCDDTSGNVSKKWNKHNSILFTLAGLPRALTQMLYNIHFIVTSNLSPPLEMIEAVVAMLKQAQTEGIEVWDCEYKEWILIIPWILAFQGDNPMSSEFASHIGMKGKYFCRVCQAKSDKNNRAPGHAGEIDRLTEFMTAGAPRTREKTIADLTAQLNRAIDGAPSAADDMATETGSKDKYFQHFLEKLQVAASKLRDEQKERGPGPSEAGVSKAEEVKNLLRELRAEMPDNIFNPVLSISHFDANRDTPVEILHVVLLGVVKYWWRDAVSRQTSKGKEELKARLSSVDVAGLNTPPIRGNTYVQYAGSLVGRDFRVVLQVALVVLHGLIPQPHYDGWVALCKLAPLMFQPVIEHMPTYLARLDDAIFDFLTATALWNTQWFNKPKFHLFVHIPGHIRRFGPLILYATESFESFNLVIRLRSIHSTKHAPSLDIGSAFSHLHAIRHLVSGGYVHSDMYGNHIAPRQAGPEVLALLKDDEFRAFMSMGGLWDVSRSGIHMPVVGSFPGCWNDTTAGKLGIATLLREGDKVQRCRSIVLVNGDLAEISRFVIYRKDHKSCVGQVKEILIEVDTDTVLGILISPCVIGPNILPYRMPSCTVQLDQHTMVAFKELVCAINVNHNCAAHRCQTARTRRVFQERKKTDHFENEVTHTIEPNDCFVNLAQLRSATEVQNLRSGVRYPGLSLVEAIEQSIQNREQLEREAKAAEEAKDLERREKAAGKEAKAVQKELAKQRGNASKGSSGGKRVKANAGPQSRKRPREEVDRDYAEGGEELEYQPRPSKSRGGRE